MAELSVDIERIVQEVLRGLRQAGAIGLPSSPAADASGAAATGLATVGATGSATTRATAGLSSSAVGVRADKPQTAAAQPGQLTISGRVVTLSALDGRLAGVHQVIVSPQAIVTPAVRDELRRRNVALRFAATPAHGAASPATLLALVVHREAGDATPLVAALSGEPVVVRQENLDCVIAASQRLAGVAAAGHGLGLLLTRYTSAAICLANRLQGVRAVLATDVAPTAAAAAAIGANVLVADPKLLGYGRLKRIVLDYCRAGVRPCPRVFEKELG
jgi:hypothetical protein